MVVLVTMVTMVAITNIITTNITINDTMLAIMICVIATIQYFLNETSAFSYHWVCNICTKNEIVVIVWRDFPLHNK